MSDLTITAIPSKYLGELLFKKITHGLSAGPDKEKPFALSFKLFISSGVIYSEPQAALWFEHDGRVFCHELGSSDPSLSRDFAVPGFDFLGWEDLRYDAETLLTKIISKESRGETYIFAITPHGAVIVSEEWHTVRYDYGQRAIAAALCAKNLSAHDRLSAGHGLQRTIDALIRFQDQGYGGTPRTPHGISVVID